MKPAPFDYVAPTRLLRVIEGRNMAGAADHARQEPTSEVTVKSPGIEDSPPQAAAPARALIDGDWKMVLATPLGPQEMTGHFETDGLSLSGYLSSKEGRQSFTGTVEGNRLKFDLKVEKPMKITLKYDIAVAGDRLAGKVKMGIFGSAKLTGERAST
jgi:aerobic carbon-monoxide dehydrogenase large subunit